MISFANIKAIFKKEFLQLMRDKSVLFTNFFLPLFGLPLYVLFVFETTSYVAMKRNTPLKDNTVFKVTAHGDIDKQLAKSLADDPKIDLSLQSKKVSKNEINNYLMAYNEFFEIKHSEIDMAKKIRENKNKQIQHRSNLIKAQAAFHTAHRNLKQKLSTNSDLHLVIIPNKNKIKEAYIFHSEEQSLSMAASRHVKKSIRKHADEMVLNYKKTKNIQPYHLNPYEVENINIDVISSKMATILGFALGGGLLFILLITMYNPAINTTLGERDQSTYKILLMNPVSPFEIFIGKYLNVAILGLLALMPYAIEIIIFYAWGFSNTILSSFSNFSFFNFTSLFIITISAAIFISALCFIICSFSKSKIQAQSLMTLLLFIVTIPVIITGTMDLHLTRYTSLLPLVNVPMMFEHLISGERDLISILAGIIVNLGFSVIMIWFSLGAFTVQWKGSSDSKSLSELLNFKRRKTKNLLPAHAFFAFCIACMGYIYGGILFTAFEIKIFAYLFSPLLFSLGTSIFIIQYSSLDFTKVINWQLPKLSYLFKLIAISCVLSFMVNYLMQSTDIVKIFEIKFPNLFENATTVSLIGNLFLFALIPAITEEILFRGIIFKGLRYQYSFLVSSSVSAILFGIIHFSLFKWGHTFILGLILAYIYEKKGMYSAIVFHLFFNAFALMAAHFNLINIISSSTPNVFGISFIILVMIAILGFKARKNFHVRSR